MSNNSRTILQQVLNDRRQDVAPEMPPEDFFEIFTAEQATKEFELSYEELEDGVVDGEHDGGIDAFYTFVNGECVDEEVSFSVPKKKVDIDVVIIQSKSSSGFSEEPINRLISSLGYLLNLSSNFDALTQYNDEVKSRADIFRKTYHKTAVKFPALKVTIIYACAKSSGDPHVNTKLKADELIDKVSGMFDDSKVDFQFWSAREILALARKQPTQTFHLKFDQSLNGSSGYVALVKLPDFYTFLCGGEGNIRSDLFEANVRDYQGTTEVNLEISKTLSGQREEDFWWFNNGVTVLASRASSSGSVITVENPQIVNGLQTSSEIGNFFREGAKEDVRSVMVKVVASEDEEVRDKIIKATNNQNPVPLASLRATDKVQRDIEHYLKANGYFYDRRKNFYKNEGKPASKIISINLLAQSVMTLFRGEPDNARARPSSLIKNDEVYGSLFSEDFAIDSYLVAADTIRRIELALREVDGIVARDRNNLRFYVLYWLVSTKARSLALSADKIAKLKGSISAEDISMSINKVRNLFDAAGGNDQVAKGATFKETIKDSAKDYIVELHASKKAH